MKIRVSALGNLIDARNARGAPVLVLGALAVLTFASFDVAYGQSADPVTVSNGDAVALATYPGVNTIDIVVSDAVTINHMDAVVQFDKCGSKNLVELVSPADTGDQYLQYVSCDADGIATYRLSPIPNLAYSGETSAGTWHLKVTPGSSDTTFHGYALAFYTSAPPPEPIPDPEPRVMAQSNTEITISADSLRHIVGVNTEVDAEKATVASVAASLSVSSCSSGLTANLVSPDGTSVALSEGTCTASGTTTFSLPSTPDTSYNGEASSGQWRLHLATGSLPATITAWSITLNFPDAVQPTITPIVPPVITPGTGNSPGDQNPGDQNPGDQNPGDQNPGDQNPGDQNPGDQNPGDQNPGDQNPGDQNPGDQNPGDQNPGDQNPGDQSCTDLDGNVIECPGDGEDNNPPTETPVNPPEDTTPKHKFELLNIRLVDFLTKISPGSTRSITVNVANDYDFTIDSVSASFAVDSGNCNAIESATLSSPPLGDAIRGTSDNLTCDSGVYSMTRSDAYDGLATAVGDWTFDIKAASSTSTAKVTFSGLSITIYEEGYVHTSLQQVSETPTNPTPKQESRTVNPECTPAKTQNLQERIDKLQSRIDKVQEKLDNTDPNKQKRVEKLTAQIEKMTDRKTVLENRLATCF